jgi:hypothetical protein
MLKEAWQERSKKTPAPIITGGYYHIPTPYPRYRPPHTQKTSFIYDVVKD